MFNIFHIIVTILAFFTRLLPLFLLEIKSVYVFFILYIIQDHYFYWTHRISHKYKTTFHMIHHKIPIKIVSNEGKYIFFYMSMETIIPILFHLLLFQTIPNAIIILSLIWSSFLTHVVEHSLAHFLHHRGIKGGHYYHHLYPTKYRFGSWNCICDVIYCSMPKEMCNEFLEYFA